MRSVSQLLRSAARCASSQLGCSTSVAAADGITAPLSRALAALGQQYQQHAAFAAGRRKDEAEEEFDELETGQKGRLQHRPSHKQLFERVNRSLEELQEDEQVAERQRRIQELLRLQAGAPGVEGAGKFVDSFFTGDEYRGEDYAYPQPLAAASDEAEDEGLEGFDDEAGGGEGEELGIAAGEALSEQQEFDLMAKLGGLRKGAQRSVLQKLLQGGMLQADPEAMQEWQEIQRQFQPPENFSMKVVDVNYTCKGTKSGGLYRYSCLVVVGNGDGVLGLGQGKAAETADAVQKAYQRACRHAGGEGGGQRGSSQRGGLNLYPIPRFNEHTIPEPMQAKFGKVKIIMYPKAAGRGIVASGLIYDICKMAGLHDIGVKVYGSRNTRSTVKCLFEAFDKMRTHEEVVGQEDKVVLPMPPGRYGKLRLQPQQQQQRAGRQRAL
ncbi:hypothetical protein N2152v2_007358 [Parachlorella kessleri]